MSRISVSRVNLDELTLPQVGLSAKHILIVEDELNIAMALEGLLGDIAGYTVHRAAEGGIGIQYIQDAVGSAKGEVDLVLLDMRLPDMSGVTVLEWIRNDERFRFIRVVVLTATQQRTALLEAFDAGADDYVIKPYKAEELLARVQTMLRARLLEKQLHLQTERLDALNSVIGRLVSQLERKQVIKTAVQGVVEVLRTDGAALFSRLNEKQMRCDYWVGPDGVDGKRYGPITVGEGVVGEACATGKMILVPNLTSDVRFRPELDLPADIVAESMLAVPIFFSNEVQGVVVAFKKKANRFAQLDLDILSSMAGSIGQAIRNAWLFQDSQRRQQELLDSRNTLHAVLDGILHPIYTVDDQLRIVEVNQTKSNQLVKAPAKLVGETCHQIFFGLDQPCEHCHVLTALEKRKAQRWTVKWLGDDHLPREWDVNAFSLPVTQSDSAQAVIVWQDRTEERRLEQSLTQAGKLAAIGQLAAGVAHEINNPLTVINANAEMLKMVLAKDSEDYEAVDLISRAGERAAKVVKGLLDFARERQYAFDPGDINESMMQALDLVTYQLQSAHVEANLQLEDDLPMVAASWEHIKSVWINLIMNARDAMVGLEKARQLEVITRLGQGGDHVQVVIRDVGTGISPAQLAHIFEPFYTTKDPGKGTGLGLATCHRIIEQHGGEIEVASELGIGTTFVVRLPISE